MMLAIWDNGGWQDLVVIAGILVGAYLLIMWIAALVWSYRDVVARTRDPLTQAMSVMLVAIFNLPGLFLYLILRPKETLAEAYDRRLEAEALLHEIQEQPTCPTCRRKVENEFMACPYCRSPLRTACGNCGRANAAAWVVCPYCGAERSDEAPTQPAPPPEPAAAMQQPARLRRASTARYTPPAPGKPAADPSADAGPTAGA